MPPRGPWHLLRERAFKQGCLLSHAQQPHSSPSQVRPAAWSRHHRSPTALTSQFELLPPGRSHKHPHRWRDAPLPSVFKHVALEARVPVHREASSGVWATEGSEKPRKRSRMREGAESAPGAVSLCEPQIELLPNMFSSPQLFTAMNVCRVPDISQHC